MAVLETSVASKTRENKKKVAKNEKKEIKKVLLVAQELKLARVLAGNNKTARDRALKSLKKWFRHRSTTIPFTEDDFLRLWKGLFYSMWMSDKPVVQEECAENIANLLHDLPLESSVQFYKCGMTILMNEWFGIDQLRLDKFLMFTRRLLRQILFVLKNDNWSRDSTTKFTNSLSETILNLEKQKPMGLLMHFIEIFLEEVSKVSEGDLHQHITSLLLTPFVKLLAFSDDSRIIDCIRKHVFIYLIRQSDLGLEYDEKYKAWRSLGFPGSIDSMKKIEVGDDFVEDVEPGDKVFDPRAGRVDVDLSQLKFYPKLVAKALSECKFNKGTSSRSRRVLTELSEHFKKLASGIYPLGVKKVKTEPTDGYDTSIRKAVNRLVKFEQKIKGKKKRKHDEIELRGGKKIKIDEEFRSELQKQLKRKNPDEPESPPEKLKKVPLLQIESIFRRNSGTWLVTKTLQQDTDSESDNGEEKIMSPKSNWESEMEIVDKRGKRQKQQKEEVMALEKILSPKNKWEDSEMKNQEKPKKRSLVPENDWEDEDSVIELTKSPKKRTSLPMNLLKNPFASTPIKKVKINTSLNKSQDVQEHHAQVLSSPAIPYDANKKPTKPLLKTPVMKSPINPFYTF